MKLYRVEAVRVEGGNAEDTTSEATVGAEIRRLHRTAEGAQDAVDGADWDEDWGTEPTLEVGEVEYATEADAEAAGYEVVD